MLGNVIVLTAPDPRGRFIEGYISGTPKPGTVMQVKAATAMKGGRHTWEVYNRDADSNRPRGPIVVLRENWKLGKGPEDAYADGESGFLYVALPGDEFNMLVAAPGTGTGNAIAIGDILIVDDGTGLLVATTGSPEIEPFVAMEALSDVVAGGTLCYVMFSGY